MLKLLLRIILKILFRVEVRGREHYQAAGNRVIVVANHMSLLDSLLIKVFLPGDLAYAIDEHSAKQWWARPFIRFLKYCIVDIRNPLSVKQLIDYVSQDNKVLMFPEGRISNTAATMKVYPAAGMVADKSDAMILPIYIDGAQYSYFGKLKGKFKRRLFPRVSLTLLEPRKMTLADSLKGQLRREAGVEYFTALLREMRFYAEDHEKTLFDAFIEAKKQFGSGTVIIEDIRRQPMNYRQLMMRSVLLGRKLAAETDTESPVGVFLPTSITALVVIMALHYKGRVPAMLNYGAGEKALSACIRNANIKCIYTSHKFIEEGGLQELLDSIADGVEIRYLEDMAGKIGLGDKVSALVSLPFIPWLYRLSSQAKPDDTAIILFTSGSEGLPKGVALTHRNLITNCTQVVSIIDFTQRDILLNFLPVFHSFGLTVGTILPVIKGVQSMQYPSPLHYKVIPELCYEIGATILFATNTFLTGYGQQAHPYDFHTVRYVFAGAEKLTEQTQNMWMHKFGLRVLQGYGVTETSPVLAANTVLTSRDGSVGHFVPGVEYRLADVPGIDGKRLLVRGPNVMKGYLLPDRPGEIVPPQDGEPGEGWYDTGDIVKIDDDGYLFICGRAKRFAKIGGEMVSLTAVEEVVANTWPGVLHAVVARPDPVKGEQLVLFTEQKDANRKTLIKQVKKEGVSDLFVVREIRELDHMPVLASGKVDYVSLQDMLEQTGD